MNRRERMLAVLGVLAALHVIALGVDGARLAGPINVDAPAPWTLGLLHCDLALAAVWGRATRDRRMVVLCAAGFVSFAAHVAAFAPNAVVSFPREFAPSARSIVSQNDMWALIETLLHAPFLLLAIWSLYTKRRDRIWLGLGIAALSICADVRVISTSLVPSTDFGGSVALRMIPLLLLSVGNFASILLSAAVAELISTRVHWRRAFLLVIGVVTTFTVISCLISGLGTGGVVVWGVGSIFWFEHWLYEWGALLLIPLLAATLTGLSTLAALSAGEISSLEDASSNDAVAPIASKLSVAARLIAAALSLSCLNLLCGVGLLTTEVSAREFGKSGMIGELIFMSPFGLWAAQAGLSAIFLQWKGLSRWQRILIVLIWAELSVVAFRGQIALASRFQAPPSEFVTAIFQMTGISFLLAAIGGWAVKTKVTCDHLATMEENALPNWSLRLSDVLTLVATIAAIAYPISVVIAFESPRGLLWFLPSIAVRAVWGVGIAVAVYLIVRSWLEEVSPPFLGELPVAAFASALLLGCLTKDWLDLKGVVYWDEFLGFRVGGYRLLSLPAAFLAMSIGAVALRRSGFRVVKPARAGRPMQLSAEAEQASSFRPTPVTAATEKNPWD